MKNRIVRLMLLVFSLIALASVLLIAQSKTTKNAKGNTAAKGNASAKSAAHATPKPASTDHPFGPTDIHINFDSCEVQEPVVHADPGPGASGGAGGKIIFHNELSNSDANISVTKGFLDDDTFTVKAHATKAENVKIVPPAGETVLGRYTITNCSKRMLKGKHLPFTSDPNDILVP